MSLLETGSIGISIVPNPVKDVMQISIASDSDKKAKIFIYNISGVLLRTETATVQKGNSVLTVSGFEKWQKGVYPVKVQLGDEQFVERMILTK